MAKVTGAPASCSTSSPDWVLLIGGAYRTTDLNGIGQNPAARPASPTTDGQTLSGSGGSRTTGRTILRGGRDKRSFKTSAVVHHILAGADYDDFQIDRLQTRYRLPAFNGQSLAAANA